jgi:hypothetical protein
MEPKIPPRVIVEGDMLGAVSSLRFVDHEFSDEKKFPDLASRKYLRTFIDLETTFIRVEPKTWETRLEKSRIMNLLQIPHFGRSNEINACVNMLLSCIHGRYLWMDRPMSIDSELIMQITGLSMVGEDPTLLFSDKSNEKALSERIREKFGMFRAMRRLNVENINDDWSSL